MARLNALITQVQLKARNDRRLAVLLGSLATGTITTNDFKEFQTLVGRLLYLSEFTGYKWQSEVVSRALTRDGLLEIARQSKDGASVLTERIASTLEKRPELGQVIRESVLGQSAVNEHVGLGQIVSAEEAGLGFKTWLHLGIGKEDREHHAVLDGLTIPKDEKFTLGNGVEVDCPHDWNSAGPEEWMWCGCQVIYTNSK